MSKSAADMMAEDSVDQTAEFPMSQSFMNLSLEEQEAKREEWRRELSEVEYEMQTMRQVLMAKSKKAQELKRKLGITAWRELQDDITQGIKNVKETSTYQKTNEALKTTAEKTTTFLGGLGSGLTAKLGAVKNSETFRSIEERVGSAYTNVKSKVVTSRSNSSHELDEALKEAEAQREAANAGAVAGLGGSATATPTTTPTQTEKPIA